MAFECLGTNLVCDTMNEVYHDVLRELLKHSEFTCSPRDMKIKENLFFDITLSNPRARLVTSKVRKVNYGFACGEFLWYAAGRNDLETMLYYNKRMKDFSDDGETLNSAYGHRMLTENFYHPSEGISNPVTQWDAVTNTLLDDNDSRRAVITINQPKDVVYASLRQSKDVPCTLSLQFFIRKSKLHLHVTMRSNDVWWGLPYDVFSFTLLQEMMLKTLQLSGMINLKLGEYHHSAGSMHLYERDWKTAKKVVEELDSSFEGHCSTGTMQPLSDAWDIRDLLDIESGLREGLVHHTTSMNFKGAAKWIIKQLNDHRSKRDKEEKKK
jgi:thymidylate synthase